MINETCAQEQMSVYYVSFSTMFSKLFKILIWVFQYFLSFELQFRSKYIKWCHNLYIAYSMRKWVKWPCERNLNWWLKSKTGGCYLQAEKIAEKSHRSFLQYFQPEFSDLITHFLVWWSLSTGFAIFVIFDTRFYCNRETEESKFWECFINSQWSTEALS